MYVHLRGRNVCIIREILWIKQDFISFNIKIDAVMSTINSLLVVKCFLKNLSDHVHIYGLYKRVVDFFLYFLYFSWINPIQSKPATYYTHCTYFHIIHIYLYKHFCSALLLLLLLLCYSTPSIAFHRSCRCVVFSQLRGRVALVVLCIVLIIKRRL